MLAESLCVEGVRVVLTDSRSEEAARQSKDYLIHVWDSQASEAEGVFSAHQQPTVE